MKDLQNIFELITPDNIKEIDVIRDAMSIFIETLEEKSKEAKDIISMYDNAAVREELIAVYMNDMFRILEELRDNPNLADQEKELSAFYKNLNRKDTIKHIAENIITDDYFSYWRDFKQKKGTVESIKYVYEMVFEFLEKQYYAVVQDSGLNVSEVAPFHIEVEGYLKFDFYDKAIRDAGHPLGFVYDYKYVDPDRLADMYEFNVNDTRIPVSEHIEHNPHSMSEELQIFSYGDPHTVELHINLNGTQQVPVIDWTSGPELIGSGIEVGDFYIGHGETTMDVNGESYWEAHKFDHDSDSEFYIEVYRHGKRIY